MTNENANIFSKVKAVTVAVVLLNEEDNKHPFIIAGTGFCIHNEGIIVTCRHVISAFTDEKEFDKLIEITNSSEQENVARELRGLVPHVIFFDSSRPGQLIAYPVRVSMSVCQTNYDLGMMKLHKHKAFPKGYPTLEIENYEKITEGAEIALCGFPLGNYLQEQIGTITSSFTRGILSSIIPAPNAPIEHLKGFQLNITATHGNSGGPVYTLDSGKVFGILQKGVVGNDGSILQGIAKAEPIYALTENDSIERLLKATPENFLNHLNSGEFERIEFVPSSVRFDKKKKSLLQLNLI